MSFLTHIVCHLIVVEQCVQQKSHLGRDVHGLGPGAGGYSCLKRLFCPFRSKGPPHVHIGYWTAVRSSILVSTSLNTSVRGLTSMCCTGRLAPILFQTFLFVLTVAATRDRIKTETISRSIVDVFVRDGMWAYSAIFGQSWSRFGTGFR